MGSSFNAELYRELLRISAAFAARPGSGIFLTQGEAQWSLAIRPSREHKIHFPHFWWVVCVKTVLGPNILLTKGKWLPSPAAFLSRLRKRSEPRVNAL